MKILVQLIVAMLMIILTTAMVFAQDVAVPGQSIFDTLAKLLSSAEGASVAIALVVEFALRAIPSKKPLGILLIVARISEILGDLLSKFAKFLHKILPENVKS
jgi:uncharacterized membrane protein (UPF0136 family)